MQILHEGTGLQMSKAQTTKTIRLKPSALWSHKFQAQHRLGRGNLLQRCLGIHQSPQNNSLHSKKLGNLKMDFSLQKVLHPFFWQVPAVSFFLGGSDFCLHPLKIFKSPSNPKFLMPLPHFRVDVCKVNDPTHLLAVASSFSFADGWRRWCNFLVPIDNGKKKATSPADCWTKHTSS